MLDVGCHAGLEHVGIKSRTVAYAEWDAYAAAQLLTLMEAGCLDAAPVWCGDLGRIDGKSLRGRIDAVIGGFPCQPHSVAGKREGTNDERWIWPAIVNLIRDSGAWLVVLENVRGLLSSGGMDPVLADLSGIGFNAEWTVLSAGEVGASHRRERVFIVGVAHSQSGRLRELRESSGRDRQPDGDDAERERRDGQAVHTGWGRPEQAAVISVRSSDVGTLADTGHQPERQVQHQPRPCGCASDDCVCGNVAGSEAAGSASQRVDAGAYMADAQHGLIQEPGRGSQGRNGAGSAEPVLGNAECSQWRQGDGHGNVQPQGNNRGRQEAASRSGESEPVLANIEGDGLADAGEPRPQGSQQHRACDGNRGGGENTWIS